MENKGCISRIKSKYFELRPSEVKVADFVLRNAKDVSKISIKKLSEITNVSEPTIVRFAKSIGYKGYREFKDDIIIDMVNNRYEENSSLLYGFNLKQEDKIKDIPQKTINTTINILEEILGSISINSFEKAVDMIVNAKRIDIYRVENSISTINDLTNKLLYLGLDVRRQDDIYMQNLCANNLTKDDLAIGISYSGTSKDTVDIIKRAKKSGAKTLVITNFDKSMISSFADVVIHSSNSKSNIYGNAIFSRTSQIAIVDMLYMGIILSDYERFSKILDINGEISSHKSY
jgi:DNA-binding MurR/RpiR family transcriptional regulator